MDRRRELGRSEHHWRMTGEMYAGSASSDIQDT